MPRIRLDEIKAALEKGASSKASELTESDYKRKLVAEINRLPNGRARRIEDRYAVGVLDLIIKLPDFPLIFAEGKVVDGLQFGPTPAQFKEGKRWQAAGVECILIGWKTRQTYISPWIEKTDIRKCFTIPDVSYGEVLWFFLQGLRAR